MFNRLSCCAFADLLSFSCGRRMKPRRSTSATWEGSKSAMPRAGRCACPSAIHPSGGSCLRYSILSLSESFASCPKRFLRRKASGEPFADKSLVFSPGNPGCANRGRLQLDVRYSRPSTQALKVRIPLTPLVKNIALIDSAMASRC
jgi:hypothetical protein